MFDDGVVVARVERFCRSRGVSQHTRFRVVPRLADALRIVELRGPDNRWQKINTRNPTDDFPESSLPEHISIKERFVTGFLLSRAGIRNPASEWYLRYTVISAGHWARVSRLMRDAYEHGLGWLVPVHHEILIVPRPVVRVADGPAPVLHDDQGSKAIEWSDGSGFYFLQGVEFSQRIYAKIIQGETLIQEIAGLPSVDQRSVALQYMTFGQLVIDSDADLLDIGVRGTRLYRLRLPARLAHDRVRGYGAYDYFIHMRDASHPEREFIEWVDPKIGALRDAEFCQAQAFGISLQEWLSIEQEG